MIEITVYRVGLRADLHFLRRTLIHCRPMTKSAWSQLIYGARRWRRAPYWQGWHAEPVHDFPGLRRCGVGLTRRLARRSLARQMAKAVQG